MEEQNKGLAELLLEGELGEVALRLEQGLFSWDELDLPHTADGSTPLISACQMGLTMVMHFLLERGVDATLCNHDNQTALHISPPDLQGKLLAALVRPLCHQGQLLEAAWRGDIKTLQHLLTQTDLVDVNSQNRNGLTPLMLAVRDVDLFETLQEIIPWDYCPTETVKALLAASVNTEVEDHKGYIALHYVSQIRSPVKDELLQIILEFHEQAVPTQMEPRGCFPEDCSASALPSPPPRLRDSLELYKHTAALDGFNQDKIITLFFQAAMEPRRSRRRGFSQLSKATGWTSSLPILEDRNKRWGILPTLHWTSDVPIKALLPTPPRNTAESKITLESSLVPQIPHKESVPSLALLDGSVLQRVRANIYNRLSSGETESDVNGQKGAAPVLCPRSPKHLAPLESEYRDGPVLSSLQRPFILKPISVLPASSVCRQRREKFTRLSLRGTRRGSAESVSSSGSSDASLDLDEQEVEEIGPIEKQRMSSSMQKEPHYISGSLSSSKHLGILEKNDTTEHTRTHKDIRVAALIKRSQDVEPQMSDDSVIDSEQNNSPGPLKIEETVHSAGSSSNNLEVHGDACIDVRPAIENGHSGSFVDHSTENITVLHPASAEKGKSMKMSRSKIRKCRPFHTSQSFNILAYRNTNRGIGNPPRTRRNSSIPTDHIKGETTPAKHKDAPLAQKRSPELPHQVKLSGDKNKCQKQLLNQELKTRQPKKPGNAGSQRSRSALDSVSYSDMFMQIQQGEKGPAIFEMFATPVYENLRVVSSAEKAKLVPQVKRPLSEQTAQKARGGNRRKQPQKCMAKTRKRRDVQSVRPHKPRQSSEENKNEAVDISDLGMNCHEILTSEDNKRDVYGTGEEDGRRSILSVIKEVLSHSATGSPTNQKQRDLPTTYAAVPPFLSGQFVHLASDENLELSSKAEASAAGRLPEKASVDRSGRTRSPVYQRFLDEVGDGAVTEDLLRCLAEELISLEEKEAETLKPQGPKSKEINDQPQFKKAVLESSSSNNLPCTEKAIVDDSTITWTKGEVLGRGAYGTVYCGLTSQGQLIAVKQVVLDNSTPESAEKEHNQLQREVDLLKNLDHPNIVGFLGTALNDNVISIFMEYVPGGSIYSILSRFGPLPEKVFALYTRQIVEGVAYLHSNRVIHRDLKGNNIMLMPTGVVKLIDFGCARRLNHLTQSGGNSELLRSVHGTPYWMAPEVINESGHGRKSDIWSIGCTVFEMATGKPPLAHMGKIAALFYIGARKGLMPSLPDEFSAEARGFVKTCLIGEQKQRPSAAELLRHPFISQIRQPKSNKTSNPHLSSRHTKSTMVIS